MPKIIANDFLKEQPHPYKAGKITLLEGEDFSLSLWFIKKIG